jgi:two-component SAPR family response regulator
VSTLRPRLLILGREMIHIDEQEQTGLLTRTAAWEVATYLACHSDGVFADTAIEALWPDEPIRCARRRFHDGRHLLVKALRTATRQPDAAFVTRSMDRYRLNEDLLDVDLWDFEAAILIGRATSDDIARLDQLRRAGDLYRGELARIGDGRWAEPIQQDLRRKAVSALEGAATLRERVRPGDAIAMLERVREMAPCTEDADRHMMKIFHRIDRIDDVKAVYRALHERLACYDQYPSRETRELLRVLTGDSSPPP